jgi:hypothetical protein
LSLLFDTVSRCLTFCRILVWIWPVSNRLQSRFFPLLIGPPTRNRRATPGTFSLKFSGKVSSDNFALDLELAATYAPMAKALKDAFEALYLHFIRATANQASAPGRSDPPILIGSLKDHYHLLSTHAVGGFLTVARFWIPPLSSASEKAHIPYGTLQCDTSHFFCGPSSNNYVTSHVILRYLRD